MSITFLIKLLCNTLKSWMLIELTKIGQYINLILPWVLYNLHTGWRISQLIVNWLWKTSSQNHHHLNMNLIGKVSKAIKQLHNNCDMFTSFFDMYYTVLCCSLINSNISKVIQAVAELGHTRIPSCQLSQCSDQVEPDRVVWYWLVSGAS